ncbi:diguanylate cyclase [Lysobacter sp. A286]
MGFCWGQRYRRAAWLGLAMACLFALLSFASGASGADAPTLNPDIQTGLASLTVARLDADPTAMQVSTGEWDGDFVTLPDDIIHASERSPRWWRVTVDRVAPGLSAAGMFDAPLLVMRSPYMTRIEVWRPGHATPSIHARVGPEADRGYSTRALVFPLTDGVSAGDSIYLRVHAPATVSMPVSIDTLGAVHEADLVHVAWRTALLGSLMLLAVLALGLWIGIGERSYAYLLLTLLAQAAYFATSGGEIRLLPSLAALLGHDPRIPRLFAVVAVLSSLVFVGRYLDLRARQPVMQQLLALCGALFGALALAALANAASWIATTINLALLLATGLVWIATVVGCLRRYRPAYVLLLSILPMTTLMLFEIGTMAGLWPAPPWLDHVFPMTFAMSGLIIMIGLSDTMQQLRRDRDHASQLAGFDALTGAMSRQAIETRLWTCVSESRSNGFPLSVLFLDVDNFKQINDGFGHGVGDTCLKVIVLRIRNRLRTYDLLGRWGGDELLVVLPNTRLAEAVGVAENLRSAVSSRALSIDGQFLDATLSLGVVELVGDESAEQLLERADAALYASKSAGRNRVTGSRSLHVARTTSS